MRMAKLNTMLSRVWSRYNKRGPVKCRNCPKPINPNDQYVGRTMNGRRGYSKTNIYCVPCAEDLCII